MFDKHFEVFIADTPESKEIHYSIRYQVYCEEMGFEDKDDFKSRMEYDESDSKSVHFIVRDIASGSWIGAMRLIIKDNELLPIEKSCEIDEKINYHDLSKCVELSRLCLIKEARRHIKDIDPPLGISDADVSKSSETVTILPKQQRLNRMIIWGLIHAASEYCYKNNINHWYFMTTKVLAKLLRRGGLNLINIGLPCQHKGERFPFKMNVAETYSNSIWDEHYRNSFQLFSEIENTQDGDISRVA